ncbi:hypothetical protein QBC43DRAFT_118789 [Cladorrhinum sp. PSN259]|nr:hypothetical protein QBC43DRAFT_118789 [Cladorrhinum sp. PSN259]
MWQGYVQEPEGRADEWAADSWFLLYLSVQRATILHPKWNKTLPAPSNVCWRNGISKGGFGLGVVNTKKKKKKKGHISAPLRVPTDHGSLWLSLPRFYGICTNKRAVITISPAEGFHPRDRAPVISTPKSQSLKKQRQKDKHKKIFIISHKLNRKLGIPAITHDPQSRINLCAGRWTPHRIGPPCPSRVHPEPPRSLVRHKLLL